MDRSRRTFRAPTAALGALLAVLLTACSGGASGGVEKTSAPPGSTLELAAGAVQVEAAGAPGALADTDREAIVDTLRRYVVAATIDPLRGKAVGDLDALFTAEAAASLAGPDRGAAVDEGLPKATATVKASTPPVPLVALSDAAGAIDLVGATLYLDVRTKASGGPVRVLRTGEVVLERDTGAWKIASYRLAVNRTGAGVATSSTTVTTEKPPS